MRHPTRFTREMHHPTRLTREMHHPTYLTREMHHPTPFTREMHQQIEPKLIPYCGWVIADSIFIATTTFSLMSIIGDRCVKVCDNPPVIRAQEFNA